MRLRRRRGVLLSTSLIREAGAEFIGTGLLFPARLPNSTKGTDMQDKPSVMFACVHNAGRSQMALGFFRRYAGDAAEVRSGGSEPSAELNPLAVAAMAEKGIDISAEEPKAWTPVTLQASDVIVTMGCGDECPFYPGKRYLDWELDDPAGQPIERVREIRDQIERRVLGLLEELGIEARA